MCQTTGVYATAITLGIGPYYQLLAIVSACQANIMGIVVGACYSIKLSGSRAVGAKAYHIFVVLIDVTCMWLAFVITVGTVMSYLFADVLAAQWAENVCEFATSSTCVPVFQSVMGGGKSHSGSTVIFDFKVTGFLFLALCLYSISKAGLYACFDFKFMPKAAGLVISTYVVVQIVVLLFFHNATGMLFAMYSPNLVAGIAILVRVRFWHIPTMLRSQHGPWASNKLQ